MTAHGGPRYADEWADVLDAETRARFRIWQHAARIGEYFTAARAARQ